MNICENCGCDIHDSATTRYAPGSKSHQIERGVFAGCWVCSKACERELNQASFPDNGNRHEARQLGFTALD